MAEGFAAPPVNPLISIQPLGTPQPEQDALNVSKALLSIPNGTTVESFVVNRDVQNNPILRTPFGDIQIQSDLFLKTGSVVIFRVDATQTTRARILTIDGMTPTDYTAQNTRAPQGDAVATSSLPGVTQTLKANLTGQTAPSQPLTLSAILLSKTPVSPTQTATPESVMPLILNRLQTGAAIRVSVLKADLPTPMLQTQRTPTTPQNITQAAYASAAQEGITELLQSAKLEPALRTAPTTSADKAMTAVPNASNSTTAPAASALTPNHTSVPLAPTSAPLSFQPITSRPQQPLPTQSPTPHAASSAPASPSTLQPEMPRMTPPSPAASSSQHVSTHPHYPNSQTPTHAASVTASYAQAARGFPPTPSATPAASPPPASASPLPSASVTATVIGHEADGATILHIPGGTLKTYLPQPLPVGTSLHIELEPQHATRLETTLSPLSEEASATVSLMHEWESLKETVSWAQQAESPIAKALLAAMPQVNEKLTSGLLFFIAAMKGGDVTQWLGKNLTRALEFKVPELAKRLKSDAAQLQHMLVEGGANSWSSTTLPMVYQGQLEHARLFYRQDDMPEERDTQGKGAGHRFIIEVGLSHLGDMQFDGFVRDGQKTRVFDLVIRSARPLPVAMHNDMRTLFDDALKTTGYSGYLTFQHGSHSFVRPMAAITPHTNDSNTILA